MRSYILLVYLLVFGTAGEAQRFVDLSKPFPRNKLNSNATGKYELVAMLSKSQIDAGDSVLVDMFITGYGAISQTKIFISCSAPEIMDESYVAYGFGPNPQNPKQFIWGSEIYNIETFPTVMTLSGGLEIIRNDSTIYYGMFIDGSRDSASTAILTENSFDKPPIQVHLKLKRRIKPDDYKLTFYMTYFNGEEWAGSSTFLDFRVNSFAQRNETLLVLIAALAAIVGLLPGFQIALPLLAKIRNPLHKFFKKKQRDSTRNTPKQKLK